MKWGRKKDSPPSFHSSLITRVFPVSLFSKFKQKDGNPEITSGKKQHRGKVDFPTRRSSSSAGWREAIFYSVDDDDDDAYWRLSFRDERAEGRRRRGRLNPLWYDSDDEFQVPVSSFKSSTLMGMEFPKGVHRSINDMVFDIEKMKEKHCKENILRGSDTFRKKKRNQGAKLRKEDVNNRRSRKLRCRVVRKKKAESETGPDDGEGNSSKPVETDMKKEFQYSGEEDYVFAALEGSNAASEGASIPKYQNSENKKFKEIKGKTESQAEPANKSRRSRSRKITQNWTKANAPRTDCRIRVLEDMKQERRKLRKKERKEQVTTEGCTIYNSFAVVKSSFNPQQDFRDSMVEMIRNKGTRGPEELEELLACYLTLNCDGHHDLIIKVFQQVWLELSRGV